MFFDRTFPQGRCELRWRRSRCLVVGAVPFQFPIASDKQSELPAPHVAGKTAIDCLVASRETAAAAASATASAAACLTRLGLVDRQGATVVFFLI
jgi:hypothetical protein